MAQQRFKAKLEKSIQTKALPSIEGKASSFFTRGSLVESFGGPLLERASALSNVLGLEGDGATRTPSRGLLRFAKIEKTVVEEFRESWEQYCELQLADRRHGEGRAELTLSGSSGDAGAAEAASSAGAPKPSKAEVGCGGNDAQSVDTVEIQPPPMCRQRLGEGHRHFANSAE